MGDRDDPTEMGEDPRDASLLSELRAMAARSDPVPDQVRTVAVAAFDWRTIDAELAELTEELVDERDHLALVRGQGDVRLLTFQAEGLGIELQITVEGDRPRLTGQLVPGQPAVVELQQPHGVAEAEADPLGRFAFAELRAGPVRLRCRLAAGRLVQTAWTAV